MTRQSKPLHTRFLDFIYGSAVKNTKMDDLEAGIHDTSAGAEQLREYLLVRKSKQQLESFFLYYWSFTIIVLITISMYLIQDYLDLVNSFAIYFLPILIVAVKWGAAPACFVAVTEILIFDFFYIAQANSMAIHNNRYLISFVILILVALITGTLSTALKKEAVHAREEGARLAALYELSHDLTAVADLDEILVSTVRKVAGSVKGQVAVMIPDTGGKLELRAYSGVSGKNVLCEKDREVAARVFETGEASGMETEKLSEADCLYLPLRTEQVIHGVLVVWPKARDVRFKPEQLRMLEALTDLAAMAIDRVRLAEKAREAKILAESERLRTALLNSLSHDFRTPLASIIGAVTGLLEGDDVFTPEARHELLQTIHQGALRMERFVNNLLDMAMLESGVIKLRKDWCDIQDAIGVAIGRMDEALGNRPLKIKIEPGLPLIRADGVLIEQVLINLLDNALKYSVPDSEILITASRRPGDQLAVSVANRGYKIPEEDLGRIFDKFFRISSPLQVSGTGLGLSICKGIIESHGGTIWAENYQGRGTMITFTLPMADQPADIGLNTGDVDES